MIIDELTIRSDDVKVLIAKYPYAHKVNSKISEYVLSIGDKQNYSTNVQAEMTDWSITSPEIENLKDWILRNLYSLNPHHLTCSFSFSCFWGIVMRKNHHARPHNHTPAYYSFVYYTKCSEDSSPLCFVTSELKIKPEEGKLILFPSHLNHFVPEQKFPDERISLAGNIVMNEK